MRFRNLAILLLTVLIAHWRAAFLHNTLKWDMVDQYFPWRFFTGECLRNGIFPLWNPYEHLGYPIHADPQSGVWYPVVWLLSLTGGYSIYTLHIEFILHLFLGGAGMMYLARTLKMHGNTALLLGICYALSGFFTGNAQHLTWIVSGAWLPFAIASFLAFLREPSLRNGLQPAFFGFLLVTGGYPAFVIVLAWFLAAVTVAFSVRRWRSGARQQVKRLMRNGALSIAVFCAAVSGFALSVAEALPHIPRGEGVTLERALFSPFSPECFLSFILPYATVKDPEFFGTDLSMSNAYFGLVPLLLFLYAFFRKKEKTEALFIALGLASLLIATGDALPFREFLYRYLPLMDTFRFPSLFRLFAITGFLVAAGFSAEHVIRRGRPAAVLLITVAVAAVIAGFFLRNLDTWSASSLRQAFTDGFAFTGTSSMAQHISVQSVIQLAVLLAFPAILFLVNRTGIRYAAVIGLTAAELMTAVHLNAPVSVVSSFDPHTVRRELRAFPAGFPVPEPHTVRVCQDFGINNTPLWKNTNIFFKRISADGVNPFVLTRFDRLYNASFRDSLLNNYFVFLPDAEAGDSIQVTAFAPGRIGLKVHTSKAQTLILLQNDYPGWRATVNGKPAERRVVYHTVQAVTTAKGTATVVFEYRSGKTLFCLALSLASLLFFAFSFLRIAGRRLLFLI